MESLKEAVKEKYGTSKYKLEADYRKDYDSDVTFRKIANSTKLSNETLMKYTTRLEKSSSEVNNCSKCKNILECKNEVCGYVYYPEVLGEDLEFSYIPCKYKKKLDMEKAYLDNVFYYEMPIAIREASMKNVDTSDKKRYPVIKWIKEYLEKPSSKGLYLNGNFGCGKTYLLSAMLNELAKKGKRVAIVYYPELLRKLKETFNDAEEYKQVFNKIKKAEYLLIDDIGAESVTEWNRDEVLGTILQYRMEEKLPTFFTSNLTIKELEAHLSVANKELDVVKSRRIIERIKQLTDNLEMISVNLRK